MQLVYEVILLNKIVGNHLLSENMKYYASFNGTIIISCTRSWKFAWHLLWCLKTESKNIVKLLTISQPIHIVCCEDDYFPKRKCKLLIVCFTQCTLFFQKVCFLMPICLPCDIWGSYVTKINAVLRHSARQTFASLGLFTWLVYVRTYCVPIATLNQNKRTGLLYLSDTQIKLKLRYGG